MTSIELRHQDLEAGSLYEEYSERILSYCRRRLGSLPEAEDAVQTTFLYAYRALQRGVVPRSEQAWLFTIAKNVCLWQRRTLLRRAPVADGVDVDLLTSREVSEDDAIDLAHDLDDALAAIPERQRQAFVLREWRGLSCDEIASRLELSTEATNALLTRARRSIVAALSAAGRRPVLALDFGSVLSQLRGLLAGSSAKVAVGVVAVVGTGVAGVSVERALVGPSSDPPPAVRVPAPESTQPRRDAAVTRSFPTRGVRSLLAPDRQHDGTSAVTSSTGGVGSSLDGSGSAVEPGVHTPVPMPGTSEKSSVTERVEPPPPLPSLEETVDDLLPPLELPSTPEVEVTVEVPPVPVPPVVPGVEVETPGVTAGGTVPEVSGDDVTGLLP